MNQTFSFHRVGLLIAKHWSENKKRYLLSVLAFMGLLIVWFLFVMLTDNDYPMAEGFQQISYLFSLFIAGTFYASQQFSELGSKGRGSNFILVPASATEKLLCGLFYTFVAFFVVFTAAFYAVDALMVGIANAVNPLPEPTPVANIFKTSEPRADQNENLYFLLIFFTVQSAFLLGSVYFEKYSFIKTSISLALLFFAFFTLFYYLHEGLLPDNGGYHKGFLTSYRIYSDTGENKLIQLPHWIGNVLKFLFLYAVTPLLWLVMYHRLKEKEV